MLYHITTPDRLDSIKASGLTVRGAAERFIGSDGRVCLTDQHNMGHWWAEMRDEYGLGNEGGYAANKVREWVILPVQIAQSECEDMGLGEYRLSRTVDPSEILFDLARTRIRCTEREGTPYACREYEPHRHCPVCGDLLWPSDPNCCEDEH